MLIRDMLVCAAERQPRSTVIVDGERRYGYAEWYRRVLKVAAGLWELGVRPGDRVVQVLKNREENCAIHFACQFIGAVNTPLNFRWASGEIAYCVNDAQARVLFFEAATALAVLEARKEFKTAPGLVYVGEGPAPESALAFEELVTRAGPEPPEVSLNETDISLMLYTSGTTGRPKGVPRSQRAEYAATVGQIIHHGLVPGDRTLGIMPLYHTMGMHSLTSMVALNGTFVVMSDWEPEAALRLIERERVTCLYLVPTLYHMLVHHPAFGRYDVSSVRKLAYAGAPMLSPLVKACLEGFRPAIFVNHYGSTEVYIHTVYTDLARKPGCAGRAAIHTRLRVVRAEPGPTVRPDEVLPPGEVGEVIVRLSDDAFSGYYNRPEATARAIRDGWYFTGDTGYLDEDGDLWLVGRVDDMIISGGENIHPVEVEEVLAQHPKVADVAVAGLPDEVWGQVVTAFVVPGDPSLTPEELDAFCLASRQLARFKRPRRYVFVRAIPRSPTGKTLRRLLIAGEYEPLATPAGG
jgi:2-furoate---CoA ligase